MDSIRVILLTMFCLGFICVIATEQFNSLYSFIDFTDFEISFCQGSSYNLSVRPEKCYIRDKSVVSS